MSAESSKGRRKGSVAGLPAIGLDLPPITYVLDPPRKARRLPGTKTGQGGPGLKLDPSSHAGLRRLIYRVPEVMVKITKKRWGKQSILNHLTYIVRNGKLQAETDRGVIVADRDDLNAFAEMIIDAGQGTGDPCGGRRAQGQSRPCDAMSIIFSMPRTTKALGVKDAARATAAEVYAGHDWVMVLHEDKNHPHAHVLVKAHNDLGKRLSTEPADLHRWRERFAHHLRARGIEANATPRRARSIGQKSATQPIYQMRQKGMVPETDAARVEAAAKRYQRREFVAKPWEAAMRSRHHKTQEVLSAYADILERSGDRGDPALAKGLRDYAEKLKDPRSQEHMIMGDIGAWLKEQGQQAIRHEFRPASDAAEVAPLLTGGKARKEDRER